ncbi:MAG: hypothetical protein EBR82_11265 [Caulobacteraceae bacterium]|nr:hypothetical protein [Caulobacteraceae bacterium]
MPTIIDSLIVTLRLDPGNFEREANRLDSTDRRVRDAAQRRGRDLEDSQKRQREGFSQLTKATLAYGAAFLGLGSVTGFVKNILSGDASIGRLSRIIGESTEEISAWGGVLRGAGGTAEQAASDLSLLRNAFEDIKLTGQSSLIPFFQRLGITLKDLDDPGEALLQVADKFAGMDPTQAAAIGRMMGFSPAMISTLMRGRAATEELLNAQYRLGVTSKQAAADAEELQRAQADLITMAAGFARVIMKDVVPAATAVGKVLQNIAQDQSFRAFMSAAKDATLALFDVAKPVFTVLFGSIQAIARLLSGDFSGAWKSAKNTVVDTVKSLESAWANGTRAAVKFWRAVRGMDPESTAGTPQAPGPAGASPTGRGGAERFGHIVKFFTDRGYGQDVARGIAAGIYAESNGGDPKAVNPKSGAYGIGQWLGSRQRELFKRYGPDPTLMQQLEFMNWELKGGDQGGAAVRSARGEQAVLDAYIRKFMRPAAGPETTGDIERGQRALRQYRPISNVGGASVTIGALHVHTAATDARGIATGISRELAVIVPQSNLGLV